ncbi:MAG: CBS domain-containing protein [Gemmatimonadaceae bacterium]|nr:CBS domain-containing protein [Gemmatimonadaceae bacterium]
MLQIRDVMTRDVITVSPEHTLREAMEVLARNHVSGAPVVSNRTVVGIVSASDLLEYASALPPVGSANEEDEDASTSRDDDVPDLDDDDGSAENVSWFLQRWREGDVDENERFVEGAPVAWTALDEHVVSDVMTRDVVSLRPTVAITAAADLLRRRRLHRVLVMEDDILVGILSTSDIVRMVADGKLTRTRYVFRGKRSRIP